MERKTTSNRILYLVVVGILVVSGLIIGLSAALNKERAQLPDDVPQTEDIRQSDADDLTKDDPVTEEPREEPTVYLAPVSGVVSKSHDDALPVYSLTMDDWRVHEGIDIAASVGDAVIVTAKGTVTSIWDDPMMGKCVSVNHGNGVESIYKNLGVELADGITVGKTIAAKTVLGTVGETAMVESAESPHLHFEMKCDGKQVDPLSYISKESYEASLQQDTAFES
ncbi:MAG: M23 family metallopeptidase [Clostridia bacterium]|nr:M23 family metallopeptidase [Clostridia bacterium]